MLTLETRKDPVEYEEFTDRGCFTVRRSEKFWSGVWTDQTLMQMKKTAGGLTAGGGITKGVLTHWTLGMVYLQSICFEIEKYSGITSATSE